MNTPGLDGRLDYVCPGCHGDLESSQDHLSCATCATSYPIRFSIADFSGGVYYDEFSGEDSLTEAQRIGLEHEISGTRSRIDNFYRPKIEQQRKSDPIRVLDCGCGNGLSVDLLRNSNIEAWGNDLSRLRQWQWRARTHRSRISVADGARLPFADGFFDVVISSGVLEHIGVEEHGGSAYSVRPTADRDAARNRFVTELVRVTRPGGRLWLDFPNGAFPIDFWHGTDAGGARWHSLSEGFLPTVKEIRSLVHKASLNATVRPISPTGRLQFQQVSRHPLGRLLSPIMGLFLKSMGWPGLRWLAGSPFNPYLVIQVDV